MEARGGGEVAWRRMALAEAFDDSLEAVFALLPDGTLVYENPAFAALFPPPVADARAIAEIAPRVAGIGSTRSGVSSPDDAVTVAVTGASEIELSARETTAADGTRIVHCLAATGEREHERLLKAVYDISAMTALADDMRACYAAIHRVVASLMTARNFYIATYDDRSGVLSFDYHVDEYDDPPPAKALDDGLTSYVIRTGEPYLYRCDREALERERLALVGHPAVDWLGVPLKVGDRIHGAMVIQSYDEGIRYADRERDLLAFVARHIALAIERKRVEEDLKSISLYDELTKLFNRRGFMTLAEQQARVALRSKKDFLLFWFDLDGMKGINDRLGHAAGDLALSGVAFAMRKAFRDADVLARMGGDEFAALAPGAGPSHIERLSRRFEEAVAEWNAAGEAPFPLEVSFGAAAWNHARPMTLAALMEEADRAMYASKRARKAASGGAPR